MSRFIVLVCVLFFANLPFVSAEVINDFSVEYNIKADALIEVTESINYDFEGMERHGIFRTIEKNHPQPASAWYKNRTFEIKVLSVTKDDLPVPYEVIDSNSSLEVKIGHPDILITGKSNYKITYQLNGALSYGDLGSEFYWNVTGNNWPVAINEVKAVVRTKPTGILSGINDCYQGYSGSVNKCTDIYAGREMVVFTAENLGVGEGFTIATGINPQTIAKVVNENFSYLLLLFLLSTLWLISTIYKTYKIRTENKPDLPVIAQYEPYQNYLPMYSGVLLDGKLDAKDITAGILYLAEQGFIKIRKTERRVLLFIPVDDYEITLVRPVSDIPTDFLQSLSGLMFGFYDTPPKTVMLSSLSENRKKNYAEIISLKLKLYEDLKKSGFIERDLMKSKWLLRLIGFFVVLIYVAFSWIENIFLVLLLLYLSIPSLITLIILVQAKSTRKGYEAKNHLEGFKLFLSVTDKERFNFHNAPEKSPELFMKYLPYAVALGVEEKWSKVFEGITIPQPDWYEGNNIGNFSAITLTNDISVFSKTFSLGSAPISGTSGSSGGGFSGGGGGRGGGGSW